MTQTTDPQAARRRRRRSLQQRQTLIIGGLVIILLVIALLSAAIFYGLLPAPFAREFTSDPESESESPAEIQVPCPPPGATPRPFNEITANVYNATDRQGLAGTTAQQLASLGVVINNEANWSEGSFGGSAQILSGPTGLTSAYSLARLFPGSTVTLGDRADESVDVVLGNEFTAMLSAEEAAALDPNAELEAPEGCVPVDEVDQAEGS